MRINGGYFIFKQEIFDEIREGEEPVEQPFSRLIARKSWSLIHTTGFGAPIWIPSKSSS